MKFFENKFKQIRQLKKISIKETAEAAGIDRTTLWAWEKGIRIPSEANVRILAKKLKINVSEISDLQNLNESMDLTESIHSITRLESCDKNTRSAVIDKMQNMLSSLNLELSKTYLIINSIMSSLDIPFYIKDINLKYVITNKAFLEMLGLNPNFAVSGRSDKDFFSLNEAEKNIKEDSQVLNTGISILKKERVLPGSKRKKWGRISKIPIKDREEIIGIIGVFSDITELKAAENRRFMLEEVFDNFEDGVVVEEIVNREKIKMKILFVNKVLAQWCGLPQQEFYSDPEFYRKIFSNDDIEKFIRNYKVEKKYPILYEYTIINYETGERIAVNDKVVNYKEKYLISIIRKKDSFSYHSIINLNN